MPSATTVQAVVQLIQLIAFRLSIFIGVKYNDAYCCREIKKSTWLNAAADGQDQTAKHVIPLLLLLLPLSLVSLLTHYYQPHSYYQWRYYHS